MFRISAWLPVAVGVSIIMMESTKSFGADHTSQPLRVLWEAIFGPVSNAHWAIIHIVIRKSGHFLGYGLLGAAWLRAWWMTLPRSHFLEDAFLALMGTALVASLDELHQTYLPNRQGSAWDVLLDCCGAVAMLLAVYVWLRLFRPRRLMRTD
jgi:VanZ family protein